jgi:hypothetical protein
MELSESLNKLQDVYLNGGGPNEFDLLVYDSSQSRWENKPASAVQVLEWMSM